MNYAQQQRNPTRQFVGFGAVIVFHIFLIWALVNGLGKNIVEAIKAPLETKIIKDTKPPPKEAPPPPPPQLVQPPPPYVPPPDIQIQAPPQATNAITAVTHEAPPTTTLAPTAPAPVVQAAPDHDVSERPISGTQAPAYPADMEEEEREGAATVSCDVDTSGHTNNCVLSNVVGGASFGRSALTFAQGHVYRPATHNGVPVTSRHSWRLTFKLGG